MIVQMARFNVGDLVRREMSPSADYVALGTIMVVVPNQHHLEIFDEYEVHFGANGILVAYDNQLKPATQQRDNRRPMQPPLVEGAYVAELATTQETPPRRVPTLSQSQ